jgi:hypothetical protein
MISRDLLYKNARWMLSAPTHYSVTDSQYTKMRYSTSTSSTASCSCSQTAYQYIHYLRNNKLRYLRQSSDLTLHWATSVKCSGEDCLSSLAQLMNYVVHGYKQLIVSNGTDHSARIGSFGALLDLDEETRKAILSPDINVAKEAIEHLLHLTQTNTFDNIAQARATLEYTYHDIQSLGV